MSWVAARQTLAAVRKLREFRRNEKQTRAGLEALKLAKFRRLVAYASRRSPWYANIIRERGLEIAACSPQDFPVLTKAALMANFDEIVTTSSITRRGIEEFLSRSHDPAELFQGEYQVIHTSGSSGEVGYFVYSPEEWISGLAQGARRERMEEMRRILRSGRKVRGAFYGATDGHYAGVSMASSMQRGVNGLFMRVACFEVNSPISQVVERLNAYRPDMLAGYTTALRMLAEKQRRGELRIAPIRIEASGEPVTADDARVLQDAFGCGVGNMYAASEHLVMGLSRGDADIVLCDDDLIYEFNDDHIVVTNLFNFTLPLIRYRMSDVLRPVERPHSAEPYVMIESLVGRTEHAPVFATLDGGEDFISPHTINEIFVPGVERFQMRLHDSTRFTFLVRLNDALDEIQRARAVANVHARLREILEHKRMNNVSFDVTPARELNPDPGTRKFKLIVPAENGGGSAEALASKDICQRAQPRGWSRQPTGS